MRPILLISMLLLLGVPLCAQADPAEPWQTARPGWTPQFPSDHGPHPGFKTEWWYFTGHLDDDEGRRFGFQLVFFRHGIRPPDAAPTASRFVVRDLHFAHFAVTDPQTGRFRFGQRTSRGAFGEAGTAAPGPGETRLAWIDGWEVRLLSDGRFALRAAHEDAALEVELTPERPPVVHGSEGVSRKSLTEGHASHYYSISRMAARGSLRLGGELRPVTGRTWFDREWATSQLAADQAGWDWFSLHLDDGSDLMLYRMRRSDRSVDPASSGTWIGPDGKVEPLGSDAFVLTPIGEWRSPRTGTRYPVRWRIQIPRLGLDLEASTPVPHQELSLDPISYWEGMIEVRGTGPRGAASGRGYLEMTGYGAPLRALQRTR